MTSFLPFFKVSLAQSLTKIEKTGLFILPVNKNTKAECAHGDCSQNPMYNYIVVLEIFTEKATV